MTAETIIQSLASGLLMGLLYGLIAAGLALIFGLMDVVNFAHGEFLMIAMYATFFLFAFFAIDPLLAAPLVAAALFVFGAVVYLLVVRFAMRAKANAGHMVKIEVEVDTLSQLEEALALDVDAVLLDNMTTEQLARAVEMARGKAITEASGRITAATAAAIAATGVDLISAGWITHSSAALDIGLDYLT